MTDNVPQEASLAGPAAGMVAPAGDARPVGPSLEGVAAADPSSVSAARAAESALFDAVLAGDRKAIGRFVRIYSDRVHRYLKPRLDRPELTDDLVQEVFLAAWQRRHDFRGGSELGTWLIGIARHKLADYYRERFRTLLPLDESEDEPALGSPLPLDVQLNAKLDERATRARIDIVLRDLDPAHRAVLLWRYWDGRSLAEMAAITGRTPKAVERLLARARAEFKLRWNHGEPR